MRLKYRQNATSNADDEDDIKEDERSFEMCGIKQWIRYPENPDKIVIEADMNIFTSDYYLLKMTANDYSWFSIRVLFGSYDIENPLEGLKKKLGEIKKIVKITRSRQKKIRFADKINMYVNNTGIRNKLYDEIAVYKR